MYLHVKHGQASVGIAFPAISLDGRSDEGLGEDEVCEIMDGQVLRVRSKELGKEALEGEVVDVGVWVEELEVDVDETLLAGRLVRRGKREGGGGHTRSESDSSPDVGWSCFLLPI